MTRENYKNYEYALPRHIPHGLQRNAPARASHDRTLCLGTSRTDCNLNCSQAVYSRYLCLGTSRTDCNGVEDMPELENLYFASAHPARIATSTGRAGHPDRAALPRHIPHGLQPQKCTGCNARFCGMCRESVDSFLQH